MEITAQHKNARMSARKIRLIRDVVRGLPAAEARAQLQFLPGEAARIVGKVLRSAIANATHNFELTEDTLQVADVVIDGAFTMKRYRPVSRGSAHPYRKPTSHVTVVLRDAADAKKQPGAKKKKQTEIETISAEEHLGRSQVPLEETSDVEDAPAPKTVVAGPSKQEQAHQIKKMQQQGGDKAKTHRRKSMGE